MYSPIVSVIIPVYNGEAFIKQAIDSVISQEVSLEIIIIDDDSTDATAAIIQMYINSDQLPDDKKKIKYIKNKMNIGVAESRNKGVRAAAGIYIAFLDADDWWVEDKLQKQIKVLEEEDAVLCCTARELMSHEGISTGHIISVSYDISYKQLLRNNVIGCSSVLVRKEVIKEFPMMHADAHEDYLTWLKILKKYKRAYGINEPMLKYRLSKNSKSRNKIKSSWMTFKVYRYMKIPLLLSIYYFGCYVWNGFKKYKKK